MESQPLSQSQRLIWTEEQLFPGTSLHVICCAVYLRGPIDEELLARAVTEYAIACPAFGTVIEVHAGAPQQRWCKAPVVLHRTDLRAERDSIAAFRALGQRAAARAFDTLEGPLYEVVLAQLPERRAALLLRFHHLIGDAYSAYQFLVGVSRHYASLFVSGRAARASVASPDESGHREAIYRHSERYTRDERFWLQRLSCLEGPTRLAGADLQQMSTRARRLRLAWSSDLVRGLVDRTKAASTRPHTAMVGIVASVVARTIGCRRVCVLTPLLNRRKADLRTFAMCVNSVPVIVEGDPAWSLGAYVDAAAAEVGRCLTHGRFPVAAVRRSLPELAAGQSLSDVAVSVQGWDFSRGLDIGVESFEWFFCGHEANALTVHVHDRLRHGELEFDMDYRTEALSEAQVRAVFDAMTEAAMDFVMNAAGAWTMRPTSAPTVYTGAMAKPARAGWVTDWVIASAAATPDAVAVREPSRAITYRELIGSAVRISERLRRLGVRPGANVLVLATRSIETLVGILGILFTGAAYVPVPVHLVRQRLRAMAEATGSTVLLAAADPGVEGIAVEPVRLVGTWDPGDESALPVSGDSPCYVLFTSGSTGQPKKVVVDHAGLAHYIAFAKGAYGAHGRCDMPLFTAIGFDLTVTSLFLPLVAGGTVHVYPDSLDDEGTTLERIFSDDRCTVLKMTPSHLRIVDGLALACRNVRTLIVGGEQLQTDLVARVCARWGRNVEVVNEYGPTEAVVGCVAHWWSPTDAGEVHVPIGIPIDGTKVRVMTAWHQHQLPGFAGELEVGGPGLARGYLNDPDATAERFVDDEQGRWYRTGDLVVARGGKLHCLGRIDRQVKHMGYRIELGELEAVSASHDAVRAAYAVHLPQERRILLFYVGTLEPAAELLEWLRGRLPDWCLPHAVIPCESIPLNQHGKVAESVLVERWRTWTDGQEVTAEGKTTLDERAQSVVAAIRAVLPGQGADLGERTFAAAGGDSISAIHAVAKLRGMGLRATVAEIFAAESIAAFAARVSERVNLGITPAPPEGGVLQPALTMHGWFQRQAFAEPQHYHQSLVLESSTELDIVAAERALRTLVEIHDSFRLAVDTSGCLVFRDPSLAQRLSLEIIEAGVDPAQTLAVVRSEGERIKASFDLAEGPLLRAAVFDVGAGRRLLFLCAHHLAVDVASWFTIVHDWLRAYRAAKRDIQSGIVRPAVSVRRLATYWAERVAGPGRPRARNRPRPGSVPAVQIRHAAPPALWVEEELVLSGSTRSFFDRRAHRAYRTEAHELLLCTVVEALVSHFDLRDVVVDYEYHGRVSPEGEDWSGVVGWLAWQSPLVIRVPPSCPMARLVAEVKDSVRELRPEPPSPEDQTGYEPTLRFNFLSRALDCPDAEFRRVSLDTGPDRSPRNSLGAVIEVIGVQQGEHCQLRIVFNCHYFSAEERVAFGARLVQAAGEILQHCLDRDDRAFTRTDFDTVALTSSDLEILFDE